MDNNSTPQPPFHSSIRSGPMTRGPTSSRHTLGNLESFTGIMRGSTTENCILRELSNFPYLVRTLNLEMYRPVCSLQSVQCSSSVSNRSSKQIPAAYMWVLTYAMNDLLFPDLDSSSVAWVGPPPEFVIAQVTLYASLSSCYARETVCRPIHPELRRFCRRNEPGQTTKTGWNREVALPPHHRETFSDASARVAATSFLLHV